MMCLDIVYRGKKKAKALAELPESGYYWKVCNLVGGVYKAEFKHYDDDELYPFSIGWNDTKPLPLFKIDNKYKIAYHAFCSKNDAEWWKGNYSSWLNLVKCRILKKDIIAVGIQSYGSQNMLCVVTKRIWIPKPKKKIA